MRFSLNLILTKKRKLISFNDKDVTKNRFIESIWISAEVFNLLQNNNIISHLWIKDVIGRSYAIPNFLTVSQLSY